MGFFGRQKDSLASSSCQTKLSHKLADSWELDARFFIALSQWTFDHQDSRLDHILQRISNAIDHGKDYIDLIPDAPFPASTLLKSVAQLIQLSAKISHAQREVRDFAIEIIRWVGQVKESFVKAGNGQFTTITWNNLADMRSLINEICGWAAERLNDGRWNMKNAKIEGEIAGFRARLDEDRSLIVISGGLDAIFQSLRALSSTQHILLIAIQNLRRTQDEHFKHILKEQERKRFLEEELHVHVIRAPTFATQNKPPCDPDTRMEILDDIRAWIYDLSKATSKNFLWLVGPPGCGKSAITASIASECKSRKVLGAQFFIDRNDSNTTNPNKYFPTVSWEIAKHSESVEQDLHDALKGRSFAVDTPQEAAELFAYTIGKTAINDPDTPVVVVFDGFDETHRERLEDTAAIFSQLFSKLSDYPNIKILVSSRPEDDILRSFRNTTHEQHVRELVIDITDSNSRRDIKIYLERRLTAIVKKRGLSFAVWPGDCRLEKLVDRASGLFIWAVTASNYIDMRLRLRGREALNSVLDHFDNKAMTEINLLYRTVLELAYPETFSDEWALETFRRLIGVIMVLREPKSIRDLNSLMDLREMPESEPVDIRNFVEHIRTLLVTDAGEITDDTIPRVHKSFFDFITSDHIPERFRIDIETSNAEMALLCLRHLTTVYTTVRDTHYASTKSDLKALSSPALYSLRFGLSHMLQQKNAALRIITDYPCNGDPSQVGGLFGHLCHPNHTGPLIFSIPTNNTFYRTSFDNYSLIWDFKAGSAVAPVSLPLDDQSLLFSPDGAQIFPRDRWDDDAITCLPRDSYDYSMSLYVIKPWPGWEAMEISYDGTKIAFSNRDGRVSIHSTYPFATLLELPKRHRRWVNHLAISKNCSYIASASEGSIHVWGINRGQYINEPGPMLHESSVECMTFSPDETLLISCDGKYAYIREVPTCNQKHLLAFRPGGRRSIAFSQDSQIVIAGSKEGTVILWDPHTGQQIGEPWKVPSKSGDTKVHRVAFRSCGNIALACCGGSVYVWNVQQANLLLVIPDAWRAVFTPDGSQLLHGEKTDLFSRSLSIRNLSPLLLDSTSTFKPSWTSFSPGGNLVVSVAADQILCWRLDATKVVGNPLKGCTTSVKVIAFSIDETRIAGAAENGTMYLWKSTSLELLSSLPNCAHGVSSLSFSPDSTNIVAKLANNQSVVLTVEDDILSVLSDDDCALAVQKLEGTPKSTFFDVDTSPITFGTDPAAPNRRLKDVRWYSGRSDSEVVWAYINNHIIRAGKDGSFVVVPGGDPLK